jgi:hypothetical protein
MRLKAWRGEVRGFHLAGLRPVTVDDGLVFEKPFPSLTIEGVSQVRSMFLFLERYLGG